MKLYISKEIEEKAGIKAERAASLKDSSSWKADIISINRKKVIVFFSESSSLVLFYYRPRDWDYKHLADIFKKVLKENYDALNISGDIDWEVEVLKGESKSSFQKVKENLLAYSEYLSDDDEYLSYVAYLMNTRKIRGKSALETYLDQHSLKMRDVSLLLKIRKDDGTKELSIMLPSHFTLYSLKRCIDIIYELDGTQRYDFISYSGDEKYSALEYYYRPEVFRALDEELSPTLKKAECRYTVARSVMLSSINGSFKDIVYRNDFSSPKRFLISFDSEMEGLGIKSPMILSIKWSDDAALNRALKSITS